jgi:hypothetical protein
MASNEAGNENSATVAEDHRNTPDKVRDAVRSPKCEHEIPGGAKCFDHVAAFICAKCGEPVDAKCVQ